MIFFSEVPENSNNKHDARETSIGAAFAEMFNRTIRNLLKV